MARFFNFFPKTVYTTENRGNSLDAVTNIIARIGFEESIKQNSAAFYNYDIQEGDTPEIIAAKYYENPERHWIVLLFNNIMDPQFDWPMQYNVFINFVDKKYSTQGSQATPPTTGLAWAMNVQNVHSYYKIVTRTNEDNISSVERLEVDAQTYQSIGTQTRNFVLQDGSRIVETITKETKTFYDYELEENEKKRRIKLLKPEFVPQIEKEFKRVIKE
jgi:hypothetical protein